MVPRSTAHHPPDRVFLAIAATLTILGLGILMSASVAIAEREFGNAFSYVIRQITFGLAAGLLGASVLQFIPISWMRRLAPLAFFATVALLVVVLVPSIGLHSGGAKRWIGIGPVTVQPGEIAKVTLPLYLASWFAGRGSPRVRETRPRRADRETTAAPVPPDLLAFTEPTLMPFLTIVAMAGVPLILQPDLSTFGVLALTALMMYFLSGAPLRAIVTLIAGGIGALLVLVRLEPYRMNRVLAFLNPTADPLGIGYHVQQALLAVGSGGVFGRGIGLSREKLFFLPEPMGDSIFAIFAEEAGFLGATVLIAMFMLLCWRGFSIVRRLRDPFERLLAAGLIGWITIQALLNIAGNIALAPLVGITLPFVSYGSASLAMTIVSIGIVYKLSRFTSE